MTAGTLLLQVVQVCSQENLDLCCTLVEKAAKEKAVRDVEEALAPAFAIRRKHREQTGLPYYDMSIFTSGRYPASLPEALRPKAGGLLPAQRRVYDDFARIPRVTAALAQGGTTAAGTAAGPATAAGTQGGASSGFGSMALPSSSQAASALPSGFSLPTTSPSGASSASPALSG